MGSLSCHLLSRGIQFSNVSRSLTIGTVPSAMMNALREFGPAPGAQKMLSMEKEAAENSQKTGMSLSALSFMSGA